MPEQFKPENYSRMFANKSFGLLFSDIFLQYYQELGVICVQDRDQWMSFIPTATKRETERVGKALYTQADQYRAYVASFERYREDARNCFDVLLRRERLDGADVAAFATKASEHFSFYSKAEFFYTDAVDQASMVPSVQEFDALKLAGREFLNEILFEEDGYVKSLLKRLEKQTGVATADMAFFTTAELVRLADTGERVADAALRDRRAGFIADGQAVYPSSVAAENIAALFSEYRERSRTIEGTIANKGKVTGKARVLVPDFSDFGQVAKEVEAMQPGEILVAETTAPEIIVACKKAAAIVTNQGGMLSHAAIISRELGIPCIIGTKQDVILNIRTGDLVEVNADEGTVRVLMA